MNNKTMSNGLNVLKRKYIQTPTKNEASFCCCWMLSVFDVDENTHKNTNTSYNRLSYNWINENSWGSFVADDMDFLHSFNLSLSVFMVNFSFLSPIHLFAKICFRSPILLLVFSTFHRNLFWWSMVWCLRSLTHRCVCMCVWESSHFGLINRSLLILVFELDFVSDNSLIALL